MKFCSVYNHSIIYYITIIVGISSIGLAASTGFLALLLSVSIVGFSTVIRILLKQKRAKTPHHMTSEGVTSKVRSQSPVYDETVPVHPSSCVVIDTKQNVAYSSTIKALV